MRATIPRNLRTAEWAVPAGALREEQAGWGDQRRDHPAPPSHRRRIDDAAVLVMGGGPAGGPGRRDEDQRCLAGAGQNRL
eukprot:8541840-Lingulodinium_polyedra.AAC.1